MNRHLALSTVSFALCFAMWGLVGALGPLLRQTFGLTNTEAALLVVVPVLLGSLARIPAGMLTDRLGGRACLREFEPANPTRSAEHTSELQSRGQLACRLLLEKTRWRPRA